MQGPQGPKGDTGEQGPQGPQGETGPAGSAGADGADGGYYAPAVDADGNLNWTASQAGMPAVAGTNIKGPKGDTGASGADGAPGPKGDTGAAGYTPVKGKDYWTETDKAEIESELKTWAGQQGYITAVDSALSATSENPVQNKVIYAQLGDISSALDSILNGTA